MEQTIAQQLNVKEFPFTIKDKYGNIIYYESFEAYWWKKEYQANNGYETKFENSGGFWWKKEYNTNNKITRHENSYGHWSKWEYDAQGNEIYYANSKGIIDDKRPKVELTLDEIAQKFGVDVNQLKIKK